MYNAQSNAARLIYTLNDYIRVSPSSISLVTQNNTVHEPINLNDVHLSIKKKNNNNDSNNNGYSDYSDDDDNYRNEPSSLASAATTKTSSSKPCYDENRNSKKASAEEASSSDENEKTEKEIQRPTMHKEFGCILNGNKFWFSKEPRSDEKLRFTETDLYEIIRSVLFMYVFNVQPNESMVEIVNTGEVTYPPCLLENVRELNPPVAIKLLDKLFGRNFAVVAKRALGKCLLEYETTWRFAHYNFALLGPPSAFEIRKLVKFVNITSATYSIPTQFINNNTYDNEIPLQTNYKYLY